MTVSYLVTWRQHIMRVVGYVTWDREPAWPGAWAVKEKGDTGHRAYSSLGTSFKMDTAGFHT